MISNMTEGKGVIVFTIFSGIIVLGAIPTLVFCHIKITVLAKKR